MKLFETTLSGHFCIIFRMAFLFGVNEHDRNRVPLNHFIYIPTTILRVALELNFLLSMSGIYNQAVNSTVGKSARDLTF